MNPPFLLGWIGVPEALIVLLVLPVSLLLTILWIWMLIKCIQRLMAGDQGQIPWLVAMLVTNGLGAAVYWLFVHRGYQPPPPTPPPTTISSGPAVCPHCRKPLTTLSVQGICPECMLQAGLGTQGPDPSESKFTPPAIDQLAPHFPQLELLELLGRGGMGAVYKARQKELNRLVALKVLPSEKAERDPAFAERFAREARALASLSHPNIVTVFDYGQAGGHCYLLMEYVDGLSLRQLLQRGTMKPEEAVAIVPAICEALQFAHKHGIVHRDIKPENILVDTQGRVKIADFGIAKIIGAETERTNLTEPRQTIGTPHYMAPEQVEKPSTVDHRADIYSLGVVFYEMLTGELPLGKFASPSQKVQVDVRLDEIVLRALEKEPARRYQQASQVKTAVETMGSVQPVARPRAESVGFRQALRQSGWKPIKWGLAVFALVLSLAVAVTWLTPKTYSASAQLVFPASSGFKIEDPVQLQTLFAQITAEPILGKVVSDLDLAQRWADRFNSPSSGAQSAQHLQSSLRLKYGPRVGTIELVAFSELKGEATLIAGAVADAFSTVSPLHPQVVRMPVQYEQQVRPNVALNIALGFVLGILAGTLTAILCVLVQALRSADRPFTDPSNAVRGEPDRVHASLHPGIAVKGLSALGAAFAVFLLAIATTLWKVESQPLVYESRAVIIRSLKTRNGSANVAQQHLNQIRSDPFLTKVANALALEPSWKRGAEKGESGIDASTKRLRGHLTVAAVRGSGLIEIVGSDSDKDLAATIANTTANLYCASPEGSAFTVHLKAEPDVKPVGPNVYAHLMVGTLIGGVAAIIVGILVWRLVGRDTGTTRGQSERLPRGPVTHSNFSGLDYRSHATLLGLPWLHVTDGIDPVTGRPRVSKGIIAIGAVAQGVIAVGGRAQGLFAFGGLAVGGFAIGGCAVGVVSLGGASLGLLFALGGAAIAPIALGGGAVGLYALGGGAYGLHALGGNVQDPAAKAFFDPWGLWLLSKVGVITGAFLMLMTPLFFLPMWVRRKTGASAASRLYSR